MRVHIGDKCIIIHESSSNITKKNLRLQGIFPPSSVFVGKYVPNRSFTPFTGNFAGSFFVDTEVSTGGRS